jgi:hypothetical protein
MVRIVALLIVGVLAALPAASMAATAAPEPQQSPFQQTPAQSQNQVGEQQAPVQAPAPSSQTEADSGSIGTGQGILIALGIAALIGGIWFVIARDARRATAGRVRTAGGAVADGRSGSATRAGHRSRRMSAEERKRRKRGRAR